MKKIIGLALIAVLTLTMMTACGDQKKTAEKTATQPAETTAASEPAQKETKAKKETKEATEERTKATTEKQESETTAAKATTAAKKTAKKKETQKTAKETKKKPAKAKETKKPTENKKSIAQSYVGKSVGSLISAIGSPSSRSYAPSCLGEGQDGELKYSGFTVYTYKENGKETVQHVE